MGSQTVMQFDGAMPALGAGAAERAAVLRRGPRRGMQGSPTVFMVGNSPAMLDVFEQIRRLPLAMCRC